jgi:hypothetical protein
VFFALIGFVFWITSLHDRPDFEGRTSDVPHPALLPADITEAERTS